MRHKLSLAVASLMVLFALSMLVFGQDNKPPVTKDEVLNFLKSAEGRRIEQSDIAAEVTLRGVAFEVDDQILEQFRAAGAKSYLLDAIRRAGKKDEKEEAASKPRLRTIEETEQAEEEERKAREEAFAKLPLLEQARYYALEYPDELLDFTVTQYVSRYTQTPATKDWKLQDKLEIELTYRLKGGEKYKLVKMDGAPTKMSYDNLGGSTSSGEFGSLLAAAFAPQSRAEFKEIRGEKFRGRQTAVYDFRVKKAFSKSVITDKNTHQTVTTGYQGTVWIDVETKRVLRIEQAQEGMPPNFSITLAESAVEYDWITIADQRYLLPVRAEVLLGRDSERYYTRNVIEFRDYHKFDSDMKILPPDK